MVEAGETRRMHISECGAASARVVWDSDRIRSSNGRNLRQGVLQAVRRFKAERGETGCSLTDAKEAHWPLVYPGRWAIPGDWQIGSESD